MPLILAFPFKTGPASIVQKMAGHRQVFGTLLLNDDDGSIVGSIAASNQSPTEITLAIVSNWIQGNGRKPTTWCTLIDTIRAAGCSTLADDITEGLALL